MIEVKAAFPAWEQSPDSGGFDMADAYESEYHLERARTELDLGFRSENRKVAEAHIGLSALHMKRMKELDEESGAAAAAAFPAQLRA